MNKTIELNCSSLNIHQADESSTSDAAQSSDPKQDDRESSEYLANLSDRYDAAIAHDKELTRQMHQQLTNERSAVTACPQYDQIDIRLVNCDYITTLLQ